MASIERLPSAQDFAHVTDWVFDLDNTLYPHHVDLFSQIDKNMTAFVAALLQMEPGEAKALQKQYYRDHGTTLRGLMENHGIDPSDFLQKAHAIDYTVIPADQALGEAIKALPGRKFIFTNGTVAHAEMAARALGILDHFDDIFDIVAADYVPKPAGATYDKFMALNRVDTTHAAMFEDLPRNLVVPKALGMTTVLLVPRNFEYEFAEAWEKAGDEQDHVDFVTEDLAGFLRRLI
ncbi:pyrimidine 5'-nucleotidase [Rhizobium sp. YIM 134829]|uniref:pyrimidine 5'-nucleotidase n=1 Tax=Rhizobium sp. YIM 134829 TaxID=3390453 RepID=UPI00397916AA